MSQSLPWSEDTVTQQLLERYHEFPALHRRILQIRSLIFHTQQKNDFIDYLIKSNLKVENSKSLSRSNLGPFLARLVNEHFLDANYNLNPKFLHDLPILAVSDQNPYAQNNLETVKRIVGLNGNTVDFTWGANWLHYQRVHLALYTNLNSG